MVADLATQPENINIFKRISHDNHMRNTGVDAAHQGRAICQVDGIIQLEIKRIRHLHFGSIGFYLSADNSGIGFKRQMSFGNTIDISKPGGTASTVAAPTDILRRQTLLINFASSDSLTIRLRLSITIKSLPLPLILKNLIGFIIIVVSLTPDT